MEQATNKKEVVYKKAKLGKRMLAYFIDIGLLLMSALIMLSVINIPITRSSWYKSKENELTEIRNETGLYILTGSTSKKVNTSHTGTGRITTLKMYPMSLYESKESNGSSPPQTTAFVIGLDIYF